MSQANFTTQWWHRSVYSNVSFEAMFTRSVEDAICVACCEVESSMDLELATISMLRQGDTLTVKASLHAKVHEVVLTSCPKCGAFVYNDSRTGPLHPLNGCTEVIIEEVMAG